jgi:hypothetical protein
MTIPTGRFGHKTNAKTTLSKRYSMNAIADAWRRGQNFSTSIVSVVSGLLWGICFILELRELSWSSVAQIRPCSLKFLLSLYQQRPQFSWFCIIYSRPSALRGTRKTICCYHYDGDMLSRNWSSQLELYSVSVCTAPDPGLQCLPHYWAAEIRSPYDFFQLHGAGQFVRSKVVDSMCALVRRCSTIKLKMPQQQYNIIKHSTRNIYLVNSLCVGATLQQHRYNLNVVVYGR